MEIQSYIRYSILGRLGIAEDKNYILSQDNSYITLPGGEEKKEEITHDSTERKS